MSPQPPRSIDLLIEARWIIPVEPAGQVLEEHALAVHGGDIVDLGPSATLLSRYAPAEHLRLPAHALIPGLVNLHTHAAMSLMRGMADDLPLMQWLEQHIWPAEARLVSPEFVRDGTLLACAEMLLGGTTTFNDMYFFPDAAAQAALAAGMRAAIGLITLEFPSAYASDPEDYLSKGLNARDRHRQEPLLSFCMAPHAPYTVSDRTFGRVRMLADELDMPVHLHLHETRDEILRSKAQHGRRPLARLAELGMVGTRIIAAHAVHLEEAEIGFLARSGMSVAHCPSSNMKLASGMAPVTRMLESGVNVGLGTDGAASNNRLDMFQEMRQAALLAKIQAARADAMPAPSALWAATMGGARALGLDSRIGSLLPGKAADICAVRLDGPGQVPCYSPLSHLVYAAGRENVTHVWVSGRARVSEGRLIGLDEQNLYSLGRLWHNKLAAETKT